MARLNISIPDDVNAALEPYRDRLNISAICAEALRVAGTQARIEAEAKAKAGGAFAEMIIRLRAQREGLATDVEAKAYTRGLRWAFEEASYGEIRAVIDHDNQVHFFDPEGDFQAPQGKKYTLLGSGAYGYGENAVMRRMEHEAFRRGVVHVWAQVAKLVEPSGDESSVVSIPYLEDDAFRSVKLKVLSTLGSPGDTSP